jgi:radical SAM superfamily enzyme YgiQ (UPF0313 family)
MSPTILLTTLNARYPHAAFGLRYLLANLAELQPNASIREFDINQRPIDIAEQILALNPSLVGIGIYIWNVRPSTELVTLLRQLRPDLIIVLGGPEVSHETDHQEIVRLADHVITGEADLAFADLCRRRLLLGEIPPRILHAPVPDPARIALPYSLYNDADCAHRIIYVEASRGCPFTCEFCLSSLDIPVRQFPLAPFLDSLQQLLDRGVRQFKFVDRTFNLHPVVSRRILQFFLERCSPGLFVHFEMVPDRLPEPLRELIAQFPPGTLQFEVGIQTLNPDVEQRISRRQDHPRMEDNFRWLRTNSGVHIHADLIVGLPGESIESFATGFNRLLALDPQEIQVGILKRLRGTPIIRHDAAFGMKYSPYPPYEILENSDLDFATLARLRRFAGFWDLYGNSGNFTSSLARLWKPNPTATNPPSPFHGFLRFSDWLHEQGARTSGVALPRQYQLLLQHLLSLHPEDAAAIHETLASDFQRPGRRDLPPFLQGKSVAGSTDRPEPIPRLPRRQARHLPAAAPVPGPIPSSETSPT